MSAFSKSEFSTALGCPRKLNYGAQGRDNTNEENSFLKALAEGGHQFGALAKYRFQEGYPFESVDVKTLDPADAIQQTNELLQRDQVVIFEGAFQYKNFFVRADVIVKDGDQIKLYEVKSKTYSASEQNQIPFCGKRGQVLTDWQPYVADLAFQEYVVKNALPEGIDLTAHLTLCNKEAVSQVDGLNQKFKLISDPDGQPDVELTEDLELADIENLLIDVECSQQIQKVHDSEHQYEGQKYKFIDYANLIADKYLAGEMLAHKMSAKCNSCEFKITADLEKSGFGQCLTEEFGAGAEDFSNALVFDLAGISPDKFLKKGIFRLSDLTEADLPAKPREAGELGLSAGARRRLQYQKEIEKDPAPYVDYAGFASVMSQLIYPLHFIDFETNMVAIPFTKGRRPNETIAFQFSHHILHEDGTVEHASEFLETTPGTFPNIEFVRALKSSLDKDQGSIFRYAPHENTVLRQIYRQLDSLSDTEKAELGDYDELVGFIKEITHSSKGQAEQWQGSRDMIDLCDWVKRFYYHPATKGSNSIKEVLPAVLSTSIILREKYGQATYGTVDGVSSNNFTEQAWIQLDDNEQVVNPYKLLPKLFEGQDLLENELLSETDSLADGTAALNAYGLLQFSEMSVTERQALEQGLLKYCELDTLAMVMIFQEWQHLLKSFQNGQVPMFFGIIPA